MRRAGAGPERQPDGSWAIPGDHLARAEASAQRQQRDRPVTLAIISLRPVGDLVGVEGPTWPTRELASPAPETVRDAGFGPRVGDALLIRAPRVVKQQRGDGEW